MLMFEMGSGRYDSEAEVFDFRATDEAGLVRCAMSREAFEDLIADNVDPEMADETFAAWEAVVFEAAEKKYKRSGKNDRGAVTLSVADLARNRAH